MTQKVLADLQVPYRHRSFSHGNVMVRAKIPTDVEVQMQKDNGKTVDPQVEVRKRMIETFLDRASAVKHRPCVSPSLSILPLDKKA